MTAWNDFNGQGAQGLEGGRTSLFPRSLSPLYDYQKILWGGAEVKGDGDEVPSAKIKGDGEKMAGSKVKRGVTESASIGVVSDKGNFDIQDLSGKNKYAFFVSTSLQGSSIIGF